MLFSSSNRSILISSKMMLLNIIIIFAMPSCSPRPPSYWPRNNTSFKTVLKELALADSSAVLKTAQNNWILPDVDEAAQTNVTLNHHRAPDGQPYRKYLGRVDQEVAIDGGSGLREFYRFGRRGVWLLGIGSRDSTRLLTVYSPPLLLLPADLKKQDSTIVHESVPRVWNALADSFKAGPETRMRLTLEKRGRVWLDSVPVPAILCRMAISQDGTVEFGGTHLIVPDAVMMESRVLFVQGIGPVLEWGIRSSFSETKESAYSHATPAFDKGKKEPKFFIEITLHKRISVH
jgi:hypothetical protein